MQARHFLNDKALWVQLPQLQQATFHGHRTRPQNRRNSPQLPSDHMSAHLRNACKTLDKRVVQLPLGVLVELAEDRAWHTHDSEVAIQSILGEKQETDVSGLETLPPRILKLIMATFTLVTPDILRFIRHVCIEVLPSASATTQLSTCPRNMNHGVDTNGALWDQSRC